VEEEVKLSLPREMEKNIERISAKGKAQYKSINCLPTFAND
jgi:hypothetical protein